MTSERRWRRVAVTILVLALAPLTVLATAGPSSADADGSITGHVTGTGDVALEDIQVTAYRFNAGNWEWVEETWTDPDGLYAVTGLEAGTYRLLLNDCRCGGYLTAYWKSGGVVDRFQDAGDVVVPASTTVSGIDAQLLEGGHITGTVTNTAAAPLAGIDVSAYVFTGEHWSYWSSDTTDGTGQYDVGGLEDGTYALEYNDDAGTGYLREYWNDQATLDAADPITIESFGTEEADAVLALGGSVTGTVSGDSGGIEDVAVLIYALDEEGNWDYRTSTSTEADGSYTLRGLQTGTYRVEFSADATGYLDEWWDDKPSLDMATDIPVTAGAATTGRDAVLSSGGHVTGTVRDVSNAPLDEVDVTLYRLLDDGWDYWDSTGTAADGSYDIGGLPTGSYKLQFYDESSADRVTEYWNDALTFDDADPFTVTAGQPPSEKNAVLSDGGHITGTVTDWHGDPLNNARVDVYGQTDDGWEELDTFRTNAAGAYDVDRLPAGDYRLRFRAPAPSTGNLSEFYDDAATLASATTITVGAGVTVPGRNAQLAEGGHVTGTVTNSDDDPLEDIAVVILTPDGLGTGDVAGFAYTDGDGEFDIDGLPTGDYLVAFDDNHHRDYLTEFYNDSPTPTGDAVELVHVVAGATHGGINAELAHGGRIAGTISDPAGDPLGDVEVDVYGWNDDDGSWRLVDGFYTDTNGEYEIGGLPTGDYRVSFFDESGHDYLERWFPAAATRAEADDVAVVAGEMTDGIDAQFALTSHLTGTVTRPGGSGLGSVDVIAYRHNPATSEWDEWFDVRTRADGTYNVPRLAAGTYRLEFVDNSIYHFATQYWNNAASFAAATDIVVPEATTVSGRNAQLHLPPISLPPQFVNDSPPTVSGTPVVGGTLSADPGGWSPTPNQFAYQWLANDVPIGSATGPTYVPVVADVGKTLRVRVTASRAGIADGTAHSAPTEVVVPQTVPAVTNVTPPSVLGTPRVGTEVAASPGTWDPADSTVVFQWLVDGVPVGSGATYTPAAADAGKSLQVAVTASHADHSDGTVVSAGVTVAKGRITATTDPEVRGHARRGATLLVRTGTWRPSGARVAVQWFAGDDPIAKATATTLELTGNDADAATGKRISVQLTVTARGYRTKVVTIGVPGRVKRVERARHLIWSGPARVVGSISVQTTTPVPIR